MIERRTILGGLASAALLATVPACAAKKPAKTGNKLGDAMAALERESGGRLGLAWLDKASGERSGWRGGERFAMCSSFKFLLAAATLARVDKGVETLDRAISIAKTDMVPNSPFSEGRVGGSATVAELCQATVQRSDNAAANLLLAPLGGPPAFTRYLRAAGDPVTRLDRIEPQMNDMKGSDPRDTTTPDAMVGNLGRFLIGDALTPASRARLLAWMNGNLTGDGRIRAGVPKGWTVADKTGTSGHGNYNDVALIQPPGRAPILLAIYLAETPLEWAAAEAIHARATRAVLASL
ncbi:class A beta-lactamase [Allosphingosinicella flava]|uniref:beta-lactamase n=1 Tax=Allosphingosinicella flava TaxID=2771430 RepID=A0A7T2GIR2_9SPHN|nr:class A beta-lactamase [Sphingosinicella flava]QPQ54467.1 class A beta-lactamase [Sphingosinicella flava]